MVAVVNTSCRGKAMSDHAYQGTGQERELIQPPNQSVKQPAWLDWFPALTEKLTQRSRLHYLGEVPAYWENEPKKTHPASMLASGYPVSLPDCASQSLPKIPQWKADSWPATSEVIPHPAKLSSPGNCKKADHKNVNRSPLAANLSN